MVRARAAAPRVDYDLTPSHRHSVVDELDANGLVDLPNLPGLGDDWNLDHIDGHTVGKW